MNNQSKPVNDWVAESVRFARLPLEILTLDLTLRQLKVYLVIASYASRDGTLGIYSPCQDTIAEILGWFVSGKPDNFSVSRCIKPLLELELIEVVRSGVNTTNTYTVKMPKDVVIQKTDRSTPEYLAGAEKDRQAVLEKYKKKTQKELDRRTAGFEYEAGVVVSDEEDTPEYKDIPSNSVSDDIEEIPNSAPHFYGFDDVTTDLYEDEFSSVPPDYSPLLADPIISKNLSGFSDEEFKQRLLNIIYERYPDFIDLEPPEKHEAFTKAFRIANRPS